MPATILAKCSLAAKLLQLILACVCIGLFENAYQKPFNLLLPITFGGYIIICSVLVLGILMKQRAPRLLDLIFTGVGVILFLAAGALALEFHTKHQFTIKAGVAMGSIAVINSCVFIVDLVLIFKDVNEYTPHD